MPQQTPFWYNFLIKILKPIYRYKVKKRSGHQADYADEVKERFGDFQAVKHQQTIWFHAVSVGETNAAQPLIDYFLKAGQPVLVTNTTRTGQARAKELFLKKYPNLVQVVFLPVDDKALIQRFIEMNQPKILLLMETELWPNLLQCIAEKNIPQLLLNARLSEKSKNGYAKVKELTRPMLAQLNAIAAQDEATKQRFVELGMNSERISVVGNIKFDITAPQAFISQANQIKTDWQLSVRKVIVLASTHQPEEFEILKGLQTALQQNSEYLCIVVPRHPERFDDVAQQIQQLGLNLKRRSLQQEVDKDTQIFLADSMGEMWLWYALADVAFVGGSLNATGGGHNILEPIAMNVATVVGQKYFNFQHIVDTFAEKNAIAIAEDFAQASQLLLDLINQPAKRQEMNLKAQHILQQNQGSLQRQIQLIEAFLQHQTS